MRSDLLRRFRKVDQSTTREAVYTSRSGVTIVRELLGGWRFLTVDGLGQGKFGSYTRAQVLRALPEAALAEWIQWKGPLDDLQLGPEDPIETLNPSQWSLLGVEHFERFLTVTQHPDPEAMAMILGLSMAGMNQITLSN